MGKPTIYIGENKGADQLRSNCEADQRLYFRYTPLFSLLSKFPSLQPSSVTVQPGVGTQIVGFLTHRPNYNNVTSTVTRVTT